MSYSTGFLKDHVTILAPVTEINEDFGRGKPTFTTGRTIWAQVTWSKGTRALRKGAVDEYDIIMVRTRYHSDLTRECRLRIGGRDYVITSFHDDYQENTIQITAQELVQGSAPVSPQTI